MPTRNTIKKHDLTVADVLRGRTRLLSSDFDGCIAPYGVPYQTDPKVRDLADIIRSRDRVEFVIVSGGRLSRLQGFADDVNAVLFAENGGVMYVPQGRRESGTTVMVERERIDLIQNTVVPLAERFLSATFPGYEKHEKTTMVTYEKPEGTGTDEFVSGFDGFVMSLPREVRTRIATTHTDKLVDIVHAGENKAKAVERILNVLGYKGPESVYIGDGSNDIPAFRLIDARGGWTVVPANSDALVRNYVRDTKSPRTIEHPLESTDCVSDLFRVLRR